MDFDEKPDYFKVFSFPFLLICILWAIKYYEISHLTSLSKWGVLPLTTEGIKGILFAPLIHGSLAHLISNSVSLFFLTAMLWHFYLPMRYPVFILLWLMHGFWVWIFAREAYHIGASGLIYGLAAFIFLSGMLRKHTQLMALSLLVVFLYGSFVWGVFPQFQIKENISWESHLSGAVAGLILAIFYKNEGPKRKEYEWENDDDDEEAIDESTKESYN